MNGFFIAGDRCSWTHDYRLKFKIFRMETGLTPDDIDLQILVEHDSMVDGLGLQSKTTLRDRHSYLTVNISTAEEVTYLLSLGKYFEAELDDFGVLKAVASGLLAMLVENEWLMLDTTFSIALRASLLKEIGIDGAERTASVDESIVVLEQASVLARRNRPGSQGR